MLAESVHQVVQGNYDRARGVLQAMGEAECRRFPTSSPRRAAVAACSNASRSFAADGAGWTGTPPTSPRAAANARA